ncbi:MAG: choice-of-anchor B family protein [Planctomycetota bacterium]
MKFRLDLALATLLVAGSTFAQFPAHNATFVGQFDVPEFVNDVWGYVDPATGKEYALLLTYSGTYVLDCSNPSAPVQRGFFATPAGGSGNTWRDARTYGHYAYVVTEAARGIQIIDLANPDSPVLVRNFSPATPSSWGHTHNICIDTQMGRVYCCGTAAGMHVFDLTANPTNPTFLGTYTTEYVHDMQAQDGYGYLAEINRGYFRIVDLTRPFTSWTLAVLPVTWCHNAWVTRDNRYVVASSETTNQGVTLIDVANKSAPVPLITWKTGSTSAIVHNAYMRDGLAHMSYYSEGLRTLDVTDPAHPVEVGWLDSSTFTSGYEGDWGCYPFQPSGLIYISDMDNGLVIVRPAAQSVIYGTESPGTGGVAPQLYTFGAAFTGSPRFALQAESAPAGATCVFFYGAAPLNLSYLGLTLLVDTTVGGTAAVAADAGGKASLGLPVPNSAALAGLQLYAQVFAQDAGGPLGFAASKGRRFEILVP